MRVLVIKSVAHDNPEDEIVMLVSDDPVMVRSRIRVKGAGKWPTGNPHSKYGDICAAFTGLDKFAIRITVAESISGSLCDWFDEESNGD